MVLQYNVEVGGFGLENPFVTAQGLVSESCAALTVWSVVAVIFYPANHHHDEFMPGVDPTSSIVLQESYFSSCILKVFKRTLHIYKLG